MSRDGYWCVHGGNTCINPIIRGLIDSFFFFQAEDGIRDYKVTGVQTCALPISMQWHVEGTHEHRGGNVSETIDARTREDAIRAARRRGIIVARIEPRTNEVKIGRASCRERV